MSEPTIHEVTIRRAGRIRVQVGRQEGTAATFYPPDPGDGDQWWVESAVDVSTDQPVELSLDEIERAIRAAIRKTNDTRRTP